MDIKDLVGLSAPLERLIEVVASGLGKVYEPYYIRKTAAAKADEIRLLAAAANESRQAAIAGDTPNATSSAPLSLADRTEARVRHQAQ